LKAENDVDRGDVTFIIDVKKRFYVFYKSLKYMFFNVFLIFFLCFLCFFNVTFLLLLKHKRTKLQI